MVNVFIFLLHLEIEKVKALELAYQTKISKISFPASCTGIFLRLVFIACVEAKVCEPLLSQRLNLPDFPKDTLVRTGRVILQDYQENLRSLVFPDLQEKLESLVLQDYQEKLDSLVLQDCEGKLESLVFQENAPAVRTKLINFRTKTDF